jgi:hypothetical protein
MTQNRLIIDPPALVREPGMSAAPAYAQIRCTLPSFDPGVTGFDLLAPNFGGSASGSGSASPDYDDTQMQVQIGSDPTWYGFDDVPPSLLVANAVVTIRFPVLADSFAEGVETIDIDIIVAARGQPDIELPLYTASTTVSIDDPEPLASLPTVSVTDSSVAENAGYVTWTVSTGSPMPYAGSVALAFADGTATAGSDYTPQLQYLSGSTWVDVPANGQVALAAGASTVQVRAAVTDDALVESDETVILSATLSSSSVSTTSVASGTSTIVDNDDVVAPLPTIEVTGDSFAESAGYVRWTVSLGAPMPYAGSVALAFADGTATAGSDYTPQLQYLSGSTWVDVPANGQVALAAGASTVQVRAAVTDDALVESDETVILSATLSSTGRINQTASGACFIIDNDLPPITVNGNTFSENAGFLQWTVGVPSNMPAAGKVALSFNSGSGPGVATAGLDYYTNSLQYRFGTGGSWADVPSDGISVNAGASATDIQVRVRINQDSHLESNETVVLSARLSSPGRGPQSASGTCTIVDDDLPSISITGNDSRENADFVRWTVALSNEMPFAGTLKLVIANPNTGGATIGADYTNDLKYRIGGRGDWIDVPDDGVISIPLGVRIVEVGTPIIDSDTVETIRESVRLNATLEATGAQASRSAFGNGFIVDDDLPNISVTGSSVAENAGHVSWTVQLDDAMPSAGTLTLAIGSASTDTATIESDYSNALQYRIRSQDNWQPVTDGGIFIQSGVTSVEVRTRVNNSATVELNETVSLTARLSSSGRNTEVNSGTSTIRDDDLPPITVTGSRVTESATTTSYLTWTVDMSGDMPANGKVALSTSSASATAGSDYGALYYRIGQGSWDPVPSGGVSVNGGVSTSIQVRASIRADTSAELTEAVVLSAELSSTGRINQTASGACFIIDNDLPPITVNGNTFSENADFLQWTVGVPSNMPAAGKVALSFNSGSGSGIATAGLDYYTDSLQYRFGTGSWASVPSDGVSIPAGASNIQVRVSINHDSILESNETVVLSARLSSPNRVSQSASGTCIIVDDDLPSISVEGGDFREDANHVEWTVQLLDKAMPFAGTLTLAIDNNSNNSNNATIGADYSNNLEYRIDGGGIWNTVPNSGIISIPLNVTSVEVRTPIINNEAVETLRERVKLSATLDATGAQAPRSASGNSVIVDDDLPNIRVDGTRVLENDDYVSWTIRLLDKTMPFAGTLALDINGDGTAESGSDYRDALQYRIGSQGAWMNVTDGRISIQSGVSNVEVRTPVNNSVTVEGDETVSLTATLRSPSASANRSDSGTSTIVDDDSIFSIQSPSPVTEGDSGYRNVAVTVTRGGFTDGRGTVTVTSDNGSATVGNNDYESVNQQVVFAAGETSKVVTVRVNGDTRVEGNETFTMRLSSPSSGYINDGSATVMIVNDDTLPTISINNITVRETGSTGANPIGRFTVTLSRVHDEDVTVRYATADGTAKLVDGNGFNDYRQGSGTVTIRAGSTTAPIFVEIIGAAQTDDWNFEQEEYFYVNLSNPTNATLRDPQGKCTIPANHSPLVLDLDDDGVESISAAAGVWFDNDATGTARNIGWVGRDDGLLVRDINRDGRINDGSELFGTGTMTRSGERAREGFQALSELDDNGDGVVDAKDGAFSELQVWRDADSDGVTDDGELISLSQVGVASLSLAYQVTDVVQNGNVHALQGSYTSADGRQHEMTDVFWGVARGSGAQELVPLTGLDALRTGLLEAESGRVWQVGAGTGNVLIRGFDASRDTLDLRAILPSDEDSLDGVLGVHRAGSGTVIDVRDAAGGGERHIVLAGVDLLGDDAPSLALGELLRRQTVVE